MLKKIRIKTADDCYVHVLNTCLGPMDSTLCGLDACSGDPLLGIDAPVVTSSKINCPHCMAIIRFCRSIPASQLSTVSTCQPVSTVSAHKLRALTLQHESVKQNLAAFKKFLASRKAAMQEAAEHGESKLRVIINTTDRHACAPYEYKIAMLSENELKGIARQYSMIIENWHYVDFRWPLSFDMCWLY